MTSVTLDLKSQPTISIFEENKKAQLICLKKWFKYTLSRQVLLSERGSVSHTWVFSWKFSHANLLIVLQIAKFTILSPISLFFHFFVMIVDLLAVFRVGKCTQTFKGSVHLHLQRKFFTFCWKFNETPLQRIELFIDCGFASFYYPRIKLESKFYNETFKFLLKWL